MGLDKTYKQDFEHILTLITEARNRVYSKANSELVLLYFNVGKVVSDRVNTGKWGENIVQNLSCQKSQIFRVSTVEVCTE